jgi:hypothetical protein
MGHRMRSGNNTGLLGLIAVFGILGVGFTSGNLYLQFGVLVATIGIVLLIKFRG